MTEEQIKEKVLKDYYISLLLKIEEKQMSYNGYLMNFLKRTDSIVQLYTDEFDREINGLFIAKENLEQYINLNHK